MSRRTDVRATFDRIAAHFAKTRPEPWPAVADFMDGRHGGMALDIGTGNGRHATVLAERAERVLGVDLSRAALDVAAERQGDSNGALSFAQADAAALPVRTDTVDLAVYVATLHHLPTRQLRVESLDELARVLAPGGAAIVSAWSVSHERFEASSGFDTTVDWTLPDGETVPRYYHIYDLAEFEADVKASHLRTEEAFESAGNCYAVVGAGRA